MGAQASASIGGAPSLVSSKFRPSLLGREPVPQALELRIAAP
jgi:hypothetical protein